MMPTSIDPDERSGEFKIAWWHQKSLDAVRFMMLKQLLYCLMNKFNYIICIYLKQLFDQSISDMYSIHLHSNFINPRY